MITNMVPIEEAMQLTGHQTAAAFRQYLQRVNESNPPEPILRVRGRIDLVSFKKALNHYCRQSMRNRGKRDASNGQ